MVKLQHRDVLINNKKYIYSQDKEFQHVVILRLPQILQVPDVNDGHLSLVGYTHKILDTRDLSQINIMYIEPLFEVKTFDNPLNEKLYIIDINLQRRHMIFVSMTS